MIRPMNGMSKMDIQAKNRFITPSFSPSSFVKAFFRLNKHSAEAGEQWGSAVDLDVIGGW